MVLITDLSFSIILIDTKLMNCKIEKNIETTTVIKPSLLGMVNSLTPKDKKIYHLLKGQEFRLP